MKKLLCTIYKSDVLSKELRIELHQFKALVNGHALTSSCKLSESSMSQIECVKSKCCDVKRINGMLFLAAKLMYINKTKCGVITHARLWI